MNSNSNNLTRKVTFEPTPNPATMKFNLPFQITNLGFECQSAQDTERSPLAAKIFGFPWTQSVFVGPDYITITKQDWVEWNVLSEPLAGLIQEHIDSGEPILVEVSQDEESTDDTPLAKEIKNVLNREIRPVVALDGGDISFVKIESDILYLKMKGSCAGCPSSQATLKDGIEVRIKESFPQIREVVAI